MKWLFSLLLAGFIINSAPVISQDNKFITDTADLKHSEVFVPARVITSGPKHHWFGYYDKLQFDPSNRYVLSMEVDFEGRSPQPDDTIRIGMVDLHDNDRWIELGTSCAWSWQQGSMLQFVPGSDSLVIWNDRKDGKFISHLCNIYTRKKKELPFAIYALSPDGKHAVTTDFERIQNLRRGYGYAGIEDPYQEANAPSEGGIYLCNLRTGDKKLIISYSQMAVLPMPAGDESNADRAVNKNWFNHLLFNTDGSRFIFLHRWKSPSKQNVGGFATLMYTSDLQGEDIRLIDPSNYTSHFIWRDKNHITAWTKQPGSGNGFYVFSDTVPGSTVLLSQEKMPVNGHNTYLPGRPEWILNDTYPDEDRQQRVYLYNIETDERIPLGNFYLPPDYKGEWRCDTHPRSDNRGKLVCIDSPVKGKGRQLVLMDISGVVTK